MISSRRRFFGLLAAPAIVSITGKLQVALPPPLAIRPTKLIVASSNELLAQSMIETKEIEAANILNSDRFRQIVEPGLREYFDQVYNRKPFEHIDAIRVQPRSLVECLRDVADEAAAGLGNLIRRHGGAEPARLEHRADQERGADPQPAPGPRRVG